MPPHPRLKVLVLDDEPHSNSLFCLWLDSIPFPKFEAVSALSLAQAYAALEGDSFQLAVLDRRLSDGDGVEALQRIRSNPDTSDMPVIILSALSAEQHVIQGLQRGADDYLPKPCTAELFCARVLALMRRQCRSASPERMIEGPGFRLDALGARLYVDGRVEHLEPKEAELLLLFLRRPNVVHAAAHLFREVWKEERAPRNTLESRLSSLRRKLGSQAGRLETIRGSGYRFVG